MARIIGTPDHDYLEGTAEDDVVEGLEGSDTVHGGAGDDVIDGGAGHDGLFGGTGDDLIFGGAGGDHLGGDDGDDTIYGGDGEDAIGGDWGADLYDGGDGFDEIHYFGSSAGIIVDLAAGVGRGGFAEGDGYVSVEGVTGSDHDDTLIGDDGDNVLRGMLGYDTIDGGDGFDTVAYDLQLDRTGVVVDLAAGIAFASGAIDTLRDIEAVIGSEYVDVLVGDGGDNTLHGSRGQDRLEGGAGADVLNGGWHVDTADYAHSTAGVDVDLVRRTGVGGDAEGDLIMEIENVAGSAFADVLAGGEAGNRLTGRAGDDILSGRAGDDVLDGGAGADRLDGGAGADWAVYSAAGSVSVDLSAGMGAGGDTLVSIENVRGTSQADVLVGDGAGNVLDGAGGADEILAGAGNDTIIVDETARVDGGEGNDRVHVVLSAAGSVDAVGGTTSGGGRFVRVEAVSVTGSEGDDVAAGGDGDDRFAGNGGSDLLLGGGGDDLLEGGLLRDYLRGGDGSDELYGDQGHDSLRGGAGDDILAGGHGNDWLVGVTGSDEFLLDAEASSRDRIKDFEAGEGGDDLHLTYKLMLRTGIRTFESLVEHATDTDEGVYIDLSGGAPWTFGVLLEGVTTADLTADNVMFA